MGIKSLRVRIELSYMHTCPHICTHTHTHTHTHMTYAHTHMYTHSQTNINRDSYKRTMSLGQMILNVVDLLANHVPILLFVFLGRFQPPDVDPICSIRPPTAVNVAPQVAIRIMIFRCCKVRPDSIAVHLQRTSFFHNLITNSMLS